MSNDLSKALEIAERIYQQQKTSINRIMIATPDTVFVKGEWGAARNYKENRKKVNLYKDKTGLYIRLGKNKSEQKYLSDMAGVNIIDEKAGLVCFYV